ncbi:MAG: isochorismatase family protein [Clostridia bacterium]|nr:isochorismatase family protein [Clostridia bacterium]
MKSLLLVIDCQQSFINKHTKKYVNKIETLIKSKKYDFIAFTKFINSAENVFYKKLNYKGCMNEEQQKIVIDTNSYKIFNKSIYSAMNEELELYIRDNNIKEVYLCGFDTDACMQKTAIDMFEKNIDVFVLKDYCMSSAGKKTHNFAIKNLQRLIGKKYII